MGDDSDTGDALQSFLDALGYTFSDPALLTAALTCPSYRAERAGACCGDNQRLEFLGDAVIGLLAAEHVFQHYAGEDEGRLTVRRSQIASGRALAARARSLGLGACLRIGKADAAAGGRDGERALTDALEAVFGALWLDGGLAAARAAFLRLLICGDACAEGEENPKGRLQEIAQRHAWPDSPAYELVESAGPPHAPVYTVRVRVAGGLEAGGTGRTKRAAEAAAARELLKLIAAAGLG